MSFEFDPDLIQQFAWGNCAVFVGAGASMPAGLPSWSKLVAPLKTQILDCPENVSAEDIAHLFALEHGSHRLIEHIQRQVSGPRFRPTRLHHELVKLPISRIFTTNFDNLLERAAWEERINHHVVVNEADVSFTDTATLQIVKLHGDLAHPESLVVATPDYESFFRRRPALSDLVKVELQTRTVLFLGYSFNDANLRAILSRIGDESSRFQRNLYSIQLNPRPPAVRALEHRGIKVISISTDRDLLDAEKKVEDWISQFSARVRSIERRRWHGIPGRFDGEGGRYPRDDDDPGFTSPLSQSIPPEPAGVSRDRDVVDRLQQCLGSRHPVVVLAGQGGSGKTHLAIEVAWACLQSTRREERRDVVFDYVAWVPFGERQALRSPVQAVLEAIAHATGTYGLLRESKGEGERELDRLCRGVTRLLLSYRCLVVLDNYNGTDEHLNAWLREVPEPSRVLVTTRSPSEVSGLKFEMPGLTDDEARCLLEQRTRALRLFFGPKREAVFAGIRKDTRGNPQAMRLYLGLLKLEDAKKSDARSRADDVMKSLAQRFSPETSPLEVLFDEFWETDVLSDDARRLLRAAAVLSDASGSFRSEMLLAALPRDGSIDWKRVMRTCLDTGLLERRRGDGRYIMRPQVRALVFGKPIRADMAAGGPTGLDESDVFAPLLGRLVFLVERVVSREHPSEEYWNGLVTEAMVELDPDMVLVVAVTRWAVERSEDQPTAIRLVLMLTHYLDSRFMHRDRIELVEGAICALRRESSQQDAQALRREALFLIDALGWTYIDQGAYELAIRQVETGEKLLPEDGAYADLWLIASAWRAEAHAAQGEWGVAQALLEGALKKWDTPDIFRRKPWIGMRFEMARGDVVLLGSPGDACAHYKQAEKYASAYGDEGRGYQWRPRLALAHVLKREVDQAKEQFKLLADQTEVELARLHGRYGQALLAAAVSQQEEARARSEGIRLEIGRRAGASSLLMRLFERVFSRPVLSTVSAGKTKIAVEAGMV